MLTYSGTGETWVLQQCHNDDLLYTINWLDRLLDYSTTISSSVWTVEGAPAGITIHNTTFAGYTSNAFIRTTIAGASYTVNVRITTDNGMTLNAKILVEVI